MTVTIPIANRIQPKLTRALVLVALGPLSLCLAQCGAKPAPTTPHAVPALSCTMNSTCTSITNLPRCADALTSFCNLTYQECMYRIKNNADCPCIQNDMRSCTPTGGGTGTQTCVLDGATRTKWDTCQACGS